MSLTDAMLRFLITPEQEEDHRMRWVALQQQPPAAALPAPTSRSLVTGALSQRWGVSDLFVYPRVWNGML